MKTSTSPASKAGLKEAGRSKTSSRRSFSSVRRKPMASSWQAKEYDGVTGECRPVRRLDYSTMRTLLVRSSRELQGGVRTTE